MIVLHGIWWNRKFHLWGEDSTRPRAAPRPRGRKPKRPKPRPLPQAADTGRVLAVLGESVEALLLSAGEQGSLPLHLPTDRVGPLDSPELIRDDPSPPAGQVSLSPWLVPTVSFGPADALDLLSAMPESGVPNTVRGQSLVYWCEAAKFVMELLVGQRFCPTLERRGESWRAEWQPLLDEEDLARRARLLARSMPPVCRAAMADDEHAPDRAARCEDFVRVTLDAAVRQALAHVDVRPKRRARKRQAVSVAERWLSALASDDAELAGRAAELTKFEEELRPWLQHILPAEAEGPFRTCFRLVPPEASEDALDRSLDEKVAEALWQLTFHLQARDDRSLLVDAAAIWKTRSDEATFLKRRVQNPQEALLAGLGRASRLFPKLDAALAQRRPVACDLSVDEAYAFLSRAAPLLGQSGFGVLVPPWWQKPAARLGARLKVSTPAQTSGLGLMGLSSLVDYDWELALGDETLSREEFERLAALKVPLVKVRGQWVELKPEQIQSAIKLLEEMSGGQMTLGQAMQLGLRGADSSGTQLPVLGLEAEGWAHDLLASLTSGVKLRALRAPKSFVGKLRPYQKRGFSWLAFLDQFGLGSCLADDMGLGKTIQFLALLLHERKEPEPPGPTLLICPMSIVGNWCREAERFSPSLRVMVHHGAERLSGRAFAAQAAQHDLVISTYALAHRDREHLTAVQWHRVALDEAQNIKNPSAKQTQAIRSLAAHKRVALTGTPVENRLSELWSIMEFLNPGYLGPAKAFRSSFAVPIERYRDADRGGALKRLVQPFILRRVKTDRTVIKDLPEKLEMRVFCNLTREQASLYQAVVKEMMQQIEESEGVQRRGLVLSTLMKLKQVCNHPAQFLHDQSELAGRSGKLGRLSEMLDEAIAEGDKALVFTQFSEMGEMLRAHLQRALGHPVLFLYGSTSKKAREAMVEQFQQEQTGPPVFVLSIKAGGVGLNLTAANHVFHFDRWWNPAVENQATDRAFRIGQRKNVQVHKFVCIGTLEERIDEMIEQKRGLAESVIGAGEKWVTELSTDELRTLFALSKDAVAEG